MTQGRHGQPERFNPRTRPVVPPIHQSVTYFLDDESYKDVQAGGLDEVWYGRFRNPTVDVAAEEVAGLEDAEAAFMTSSGMDVVQVDAVDLDAWRAAVAAGPTRLLYVETLANPQLELADLPALARI